MKYSIIKETVFNNIPKYHVCEWVTETKGFIFKKENSYWKFLDVCYSVQQAEEIIARLEFTPEWEKIK